MDSSFLQGITMLALFPLPPSAFPTPVSYTAAAAVPAAAAAVAAARVAARRTGGRGRSRSGVVVVTAVTEAVTEADAVTREATGVGTCLTAEQGAAGVTGHPGSLRPPPQSRSQHPLGDAPLPQSLAHLSVDAVLLQHGVQLLHGVRVGVGRHVLRRPRRHGQPAVV